MFYIYMANIVKFVTKNLGKISFCCMLLLLIVAYFLVSMYNNKKVSFKDSMANPRVGSTEVKTGKSGPGAMTDAQAYAKVKGISTNTHGLPPSCNNDASVDPRELLPKDTNSEWAKLNPTASGDLSEVNLLKAGHHIGVNTVGQSLRNANQQLRSDPPCPQLNVGPWNNTTIEPDLSRVPLEIGQGGQ